jgi:AraC family transcriptional activator of pobA
MRKKTVPVYNIEDFKYLGTETDFYANTFATHLKQHYHFILAPHRHAFYLSVLFTKGSGTHEIDFNTYDIKPGSVFMLFPGQVHTWKPSEDTDGYIVFHNKEFYDINFTYEKVENYPFFSSIQNSPLILLKNNDRKKIEAIYREIVEEYHDNRLMKFQKICSRVNDLYIELSRLYLPAELRARQNENFLTRLRKLQNLIEKNFKTVKYPKQYAQMMNMSQKHLNRICKACLNKTTSEIIADRIIVEAKRMLVFSKYSVSQISAELGYTDNSYFYRLFKKKAGQTPSEFMDKFRKD